MSKIWLVILCHASLRLHAVEFSWGHTDCMRTHLFNSCHSQTEPNQMLMTTPTEMYAMPPPNGSFVPNQPYQGIIFIGALKKV